MIADRTFYRIYRQNTAASLQKLSQDFPSAQAAGGIKPGTSTCPDTASVEIYSPLRYSTSVISTNRQDALQEAFA